METFVILMDYLNKATLHYYPADVAIESRLILCIVSQLPVGGTVTTGATPQLSGRESGGRRQRLLA